MDTFCLPLVNFYESNKTTERILLNKFVIYKVIDESADHYVVELPDFDFDATVSKKDEGCMFIIMNGGGDYAY